MVKKKRKKNQRKKEEKGLDSLPPWVKLIVLHLPQLKNVLLNPPQPTKLLMPFGTLDKIFGMERLKTLELIDALLGLQSKPVDKALLELDMFTVILDLFFQYEWNNFVHHEVQNILEHILDEDHLELKISLFTKTKILDRIISAEKASKEQQALPGGVRKAYMGHLLNIAEKIKELSQNDEVIQNQLKDNESWKQFTETVLADKEKTDNQNLGGPLPKTNKQNDRFSTEVTDFASLNRSLQSGSGIGGIDLSNYANYYEEDQDDDGDENENDEDQDMHNEHDETDNHDIPEHDKEDDDDLGDDVDIDSETDADDYDTEQSEVLLTKQEIEAIEV